MNSKITNYIEVLFKDIPSTKKSQELKEELLSTLNDHFEAHLAEGKSENQAYTEALSDLGDIDALLKDLEPNLELKTKIDEYRKVRAKNTSISISLYILSVVFVVIFGGLGEVLPNLNEESFGIIGVVLMFICIAAATGLLIYTHMSKPQDVAEYISINGIERTKSYSKKAEKFLKSYWLLVTAIYLLISFTTSAWGITWIIWLIGAAVKNAIESFFFSNDDEE